MATHDDSDLDRWVDDRMATLGPNSERQPDVDGQLAQLKARRATGGGRWLLGTWLVVAAAVMWLGVVVLQVGRPGQGDRPEMADAAQSDGETAGRLATVDAGSGVALSARRRASRPTLIPMAQRAAAPGFTLPDKEGGSVALADYAGQVLLLNFWATWCQPCVAEMPWFVAFHDVFADRGLAVLGVSVDEPGWEVVRPFLEQRPVNYRIALADSAERLAPFGPISILPTTWIIDRRGRIAAQHVGLVDRLALEAEIRLLLDE